MTSSWQLGKIVRKNVWGFRENCPGNFLGMLSGCCPRECPGECSKGVSGEWPGKCLEVVRGNFPESIFAGANVRGLVNRQTNTQTDSFWSAILLAQPDEQTKNAKNREKCKQVDQLSQRDRTAGWVSFGQKWKTIFCRHYRCIFNHCDKSASEAIELGEITKNKGCYLIQGHRCRKQSKARKRI